ncbi:glycosyltransferase [Waterburya agarophytonicola K14]|uniref:Glycosyltransferase n=1 Tax=Waterburya agarophytonicola KI4 TaxID=2874699 RepID=A0A964BTY8_9CYAN|nr:glycosyltransferase [Waterburya agarophytonicola]MCC0178186.1 glycosyltransferase [Waterburya agarophytonicola KI4]
MQPLQTIALISVHSDPANETGRQNIYVRQVGEALSRMGWQVDMFTRKTEINQEEIVQHNPLCRTIRLTAGAKQFIRQEKLIGCLPQFLQQLLKFQAENNLQYRLIHTNYWLSAWVGMELKKIQSLKHIHTYHSLGAVKYIGEQQLDNLAKSRLEIEKTCLETADLNIATCPQQRDYLRDLVSDRGNIEIIPGGTDIDLFGSISQIKARQKLEIEPDQFNILYVGGFDRDRGVETLVKAISKPQLHSKANIRLTLINDSCKINIIEQKRIEKLVWDAGLDNITTFVSRFSRSQLAVYHAAADVCVVPSHYNPSGMVAMDAMASGTPVIASNLGGLKYVIEDQKNGLLFPSQNSFLLARAIFHLLTKPQLRLRMSVMARERVFELFTWDGVAQQLNEIYLEQIGRQNLELLDKSLSYSIQAIKA